MKDLKSKINQKKYNNNFSKKLINAERDFLNIYESCNYKFKKGCGSYLFDGYKYEYDIKYYEKQKNLFEIVKKKKNVLEIGTYMAHSILLMLISNERLKITTIDIDKTYAEQAIKYLKKRFPQSCLNFIHGDSLRILNSLNEKFDFFHFDGLHKNKRVTMEFTSCLKLIDNNPSFLFDDSINIEPLKKNIVSTFKILETKELKHSLGGNYYVSILFPKNFFLFSKFIFFLKI